jgi:hypothetical protein
MIRSDFFGDRSTGTNQTSEVRPQPAARIARSDPGQLALELTGQHPACGKSTGSRFLLTFEDARTHGYAAACPGLVRRLWVIASGFERPARRDAMYNSQLR